MSLTHVRSPTPVFTLIEEASNEFVCNLSHVKEDSIPKRFKLFNSKSFSTNKSPLLIIPWFDEFINIIAVKIANIIIFYHNFERKKYTEKGVKGESHLFLFVFCFNNYQKI